MRIKRQILVLLMISFIVVMSLSAYTALAQTVVSTWSPPESMGYGWWQSVTVDREGTVHVGWYGSLRSEEGEHLDTDPLMYRYRPLHGTWTDAIDVIDAGSGGYTVRNALGVGPDGALFVLYREGTQHSFARSHAALSTRAPNWQYMGGVNRGGYYLDMLVDGEGTIHAITSEHGVNAITHPDLSASLEQYQCFFCGDIIYRRSNDGGRTWSTPQNLSNSFEGGADRPRIWQGQSGRIYVDWDEGLDWYIGRGTAQDVRLIYSDDGGISWSDPIVLDGGGLADRNPIQIASTELSNGDLMVVWRYFHPVDRNIYYQLSSDLGETWTDPEAIPGIIARHPNATTLDGYDLITDLSGTVHLFATGHTGQAVNDPVSLYHLEYRQDRWLQPQVVALGKESVPGRNFEPGMWPEWPKAAVGPLNDIHLTWFIRHKDERNMDTGLEVFYAYRTGTLPGRAVPTFEPTSAPTSTPVAIVQFDATPTPLPVVEPIRTTNVRSTADQYATQTLVSGFLISLLFCAGVVVLTGFRPRR